MGDIADMVLSGLLDEQTGEVIDGEAPGYPRTKQRRLVFYRPHGCPRCNKRFGTVQGLADHQRDKHAKAKTEPNPPA